MLPVLTAECLSASEHTSWFSGELPYLEINVAVLYLSLLSCLPAAATARDFSHTTTPPSSLTMTRRPNVVVTILQGLLLSISALLVIGQGTPSQSISTFQNLPARFLFFDDTDVSTLGHISIIPDRCLIQTAIFHDLMEGNIYVTLDEGKSWKLAEGVPSGVASMFIEHPVDNRYVRYILSPSFDLLTYY